MMYNCLIIDDEPLARELIERYLEKIPNLHLIGSCTNAIEASSVLSTEKVDLLFLDIEMPALKGTDFFKNLIYKPSVIFTTAYRDYALDGFELNAVDYLLKPIFFERFFSAIQKFLGKQEVKINSNYNTDKKEELNHIFVNKSKKKIKVIFDDILYIESLKDYIRIHTLDQQLVIKGNIGKIETQLPSSLFLRTHRSYIVSLNKLTAYTKNDVEIGKIEIPIGSSYTTKVFPVLEKD